MNKFAKGDWVRVTDPRSSLNDRIAVIDEVIIRPRNIIYQLRFNDVQLFFWERDLVLAIPPVEEVLAEMERESA